MGPFIHSILFDVIRETIHQHHSNCNVDCQVNSNVIFQLKYSIYSDLKMLLFYGQVLVPLRSSRVSTQI